MRILQHDGDWSDNVVELMMRAPRDWVRWSCALLAIPSRTPTFFNRDLFGNYHIYSPNTYTIVWVAHNLLCNTDRRACGLTLGSHIVMRFIKSIHITYIYFRCICKAQLVHVTFPLEKDLTLTSLMLYRRPHTVDHFHKIDAGVYDIGTPKLILHRFGIWTRTSVMDLQVCLLHFQVNAADEKTSLHFPRSLILLDSWRCLNACCAHISTCRSRPVGVPVASETIPIGRFMKIYYGDKALRSVSCIVSHEYGICNHVKWGELPCYCW